MKKSIITLLCLGILLFSQDTFALSYNSDFAKVVRYGENSSETIKKAKLLEKYTRDYKNELLELQKKFKIQSAPIMISTEGEVELMIDALIKIQSKYIEKDDAEKILSSVVTGLKKINIRLEPYIKNQQMLYQEMLNETKRKYIIIGNKISDSLFIFIKKLSIALTKKSQLTEAQRDVVKSLARLNENRDKIQKFAEIKFQTKDEMKQYFIDIIRSIRTEVKTIKNLLN